MVLKDIPATIYGTDMKLIYISMSILFNAVKYLFYIKWSAILRHHNLTTRFRKELGKIYLFSIIDYINPKVVITFIDNHGLFHMLCREYNKSSFIAIQNGSRLCMAG